MKEIIAKGIPISLFQKNELDYISITDIAKLKSKSSPDEEIKNWLRTRNTIEFLGLWEKISAGSNSFVLSPQKWIENTNAIGLISKSGRYGGGTFAYKRHRV